MTASRLDSITGANFLAEKLADIALGVIELNNWRVLNALNLEVPRHEKLLAWQFKDMACVVHPFQLEPSVLLGQ